MKLGEKDFPGSWAASITVVTTIRTIFCCPTNIKTRPDGCRNTHTHTEHTGKDVMKYRPDVFTDQKQVRKSLSPPSRYSVKTAGIFPTRRQRRTDVGFYGFPVLVSTSQDCGVALGVFPRVGIIAVARGKL